MSPDTLESIVGAEIADAISYIDTAIGPQRSKAINYYFGGAFGNEEQGRSQVVSRDVADTINAVLPSLMRIFFGPEHVVEFEGEGPEDDDFADQATNYVDYVITRDNDGFMIFHSLIKNALREKSGIAKYWWDDSETTNTVTYSGLDEAALTLALDKLARDGKAELIEASEDETGITARCKVTRKRNRVKVEALPPEEFLVDRRARSIDEAVFVAHRSMKSVSDLVSMGYKRADVEEYAQDGDDLGWARERIARNPYGFAQSFDAGDAQRLVMYVEAYPYIDFDGDGVAELRRVCTMGSSFKVILNESCDERPFAFFECDPEPHTVFGQSIADKTEDIQYTKSAIWRASMDSLAQSIFPRTVVTENNGYILDAMNTEVGAVLRQKSVGGYEFQTLPFVGEQAFPMLTYMDEVRENRTGMSKVSMGLDAEALQGTTATAAEAQFTRSQDRIDLYARIMASGMKRLFRGVLRLLIDNQKAERNIKLGKQWVPVDPRQWRADMDAVCNVGLGGGTAQQKGQLLALVAQKQEQIIMTAGPSNPLCGLKELRNTYAKLLELGGFKNPDAFFRDPNAKPDPNQQPPAPAPPSPEAIAAQTEAQTAQAELQLKQQAQEIDTQKAVAAHDLAQQKLQLEAQAQQHAQELAEAKLNADLAMAQQKLDYDSSLALAEMNAKYKTSIDVATIKSQAEQFRAHADIALEVMDHQHDHAIADVEHEHAMELAQHAVDNAPEPAPKGSE